METITENRQIVVKNKVLTLANVRAVARVVVNELESLSEDECKKVDFAFSVRCDDGSSFQSESIEIFAEDSVITRRRVTHINIRYSYYPTKALVEVALRHGDMDATITVSGRNRMWVAGTLDNLASLFESFSPQVNPYLKHPVAIEFGVAMGIGSIIFFLLGFLPFDPPKEEDARKFVWLTDALTQFPMLRYVIKYAAIWFMGMPWTSFVNVRFKRLWPSIELQIGPEHLMIEKLRRKLLAAVFVLGVVPLLIAVLYDILKAVAGH